MHRTRRDLDTCAVAGLLLVFGGTGLALAQSPSGLAPLSLEPTRPPVITGSASGPRVTVGPGLARSRTLLGEIARLAGFEFRNLAQVPDTEVYVDFSAAPLLSVVDRILGYARVDFVLVTRNGSELQIAAVFDRSAGVPPSALPSAATVAATSQQWQPDLPIPAPVDLPPVDPATATPGQPLRGTPLNVRPEVIQIDGSPTWQPIEMVPAPVEIPAGMTPQAFPVAVPPASNARPKGPGGR